MIEAISGLEAQYEAFTQEMEGRIHNAGGTTPSPVQTSFFEASLENLRSNRQYRRLACDYLGSENNPSHPYRMQKWFYGHQALLLGLREKNVSRYPEGFASPDTFSEVIQEGLSDSRTPMYRWLLRNLMERNIDKNKSERAKAAAFAAGILFKRLAYERGDAAYYEPGTANGHILKALATSSVGTATMLDDHESEDRAMSLSFDNIAGLAPFHLGVGVDLSPPDHTDSDDMLWLKGCSLSPEDLGTVAEEEFDNMVMMSPENVHIVKGDFLSLQPADLPLLTKRKAHIAYLPHVIAQNQGRLQETVDAVLPFMARNALIVINDYVSVSPDNPLSLTVEADWHQKPWSCRTVVFDVARKNDGFHELIKWRTSLCEEGILNLGEYERLLQPNRK